MSQVVTNGCVGLCCAAFSAPSRTNLREQIRQGGPDSEAAQILDMLIPLTPKEANERNRQFGGPGNVFTWEHRGRHYTCRHWDEETRLCTNYEGRPSMCSKFPYAREEGCPFGCSCKGSPLTNTLAESPDSADQHEEESEDG